MEKIKLTNDKITLKDDKVSCDCCGCKIGALNLTFFKNFSSGTYTATSFRASTQFNPEEYRSTQTQWDWGVADTAGLYIRDFQTNLYEFVGLIDGSPNSSVTVPINVSSRHVGKIYSLTRASGTLVFNAEPVPGFFDTTNECGIELMVWTPPELRNTGSVGSENSERTKNGVFNGSVQHTVFSPIRLDENRNCRKSGSSCSGGNQTLQTVTDKNGIVTVFEGYSERIQIFEPVRMYSSNLPFPEPGSGGIRSYGWDSSSRNGGTENGVRNVAFPPNGLWDHQFLHIVKIQSNNKVLEADKNPLTGGYLHSRYVGPQTESFPQPGDEIEEEPYRSWFLRGNTLQNFSQGGIVEMAVQSRLPNLHIPINVEEFSNFSCSSYYASTAIAQYLSNCVPIDRRAQALYITIKANDVF